MRCIGKGQRSGQVFCAMLNLPPPSSKFVKSNSAILDSLKIVSLGSLLNAVREAKLLNNNNSTDIIVACDGSWQKRGHTSLNGMISVTSIESGKVLDIKCLTKYYHSCAVIQDDHECVKNFVGASGNMEAAGAVAMFKRSWSDQGLRYVKYLGDGDSKGFIKVSECKSYGGNVKIENGIYCSWSWVSTCSVLKDYVAVRI